MIPLGSWIFNDLLLNSVSLCCDGVVERPLSIIIVPSTSIVKNSTNIHPYQNPFKQINNQYADA